MCIRDRHSVKELRGLGIQPDLIVVRTEYEMGQELKDKIALFCDINKESVIECRDAESLYEIPLQLSHQNMDDLVIERLGLEAQRDTQLDEWNHLIQVVNHLEGKVKIALVGKYVALQDAYLSVVESLKHAGYPFMKDIDIRWIDSSEVTDENAADYLSDVDGILVPGGFGFRASEGKISAIKYAREQQIPFFGICLGMQLATVEYARHVVGLKDAHSTELDPNTPYPVIDLLPEQKDIEDLGGTLRLGLYPCSIKEGSLANEIYGQTSVEERHRHRYEFNNEFRAQLEEAGMIFSGTSPDGRLVEMVELENHPFFIACQFHPEFLSRPNRPQPIFKSFIEAAIQQQNRVQ